MSVRADQYYATVPEWVLYADVSANAVRLYAVLRRYADKEGRAHPSLKKLAEHMHCSIDTVRRSVRELQRIKAIKAVKRYSEGRQTSNDYVLISLPPPSNGARDGGSTDAGGDPSTGAMGENQSQKEPEPEEPDSAPKARKRDLLFEALAESVGIDWHELTRNARDQLNDAVKQLREVGATPDEVRHRAANYPRIMPSGSVLTAHALVTHWPRLGGEPMSATLRAAQQLMEARS